jgi:hypothetical protein
MITDTFSGWSTWPPDPETWLRLTRAVDRLLSMTAAPPLQLDWSGSAPALSAVLLTGFWAKIDVAGTNGSYSWTRLSPKRRGLELPPAPQKGIGEGLSGGPNNPAYVAALTAPGTAVANGTVVWLWPGALGEGFQQWLFAPAATAGLVRGKLDGAMAVGGSAVLSIWAWTGTAEADTGENITVYDWLLAGTQTIAAGRNVVAALVGGRWYIIAAAC